MDTMGNGAAYRHAPYYRRGMPVTYYPYMMPLYNHPPAPVHNYYQHQPQHTPYTPQFTEERVAESWRPKRPSKSPRAVHRIATPPYTPPGAKAGTNSEKRLERLRKQSEDYLHELQIVDKRIKEMEAMVRRQLYDIGLRQYTGDY